MLISLALDFRRANLDTRERFHLSEERVTELYAAPRRSPVRELALVSTCNRVELYGWTEGAEAVVVYRAMSDLASRWMACERRADELIGTAVHRVGSPAARHLMRVTSGLESQVLGDAQILGQVRRAYRRAEVAGALGPGLHRLFGGALRAAKRVQSETGLVAHRRSIGSEAAAIAGRRSGPLGQRRCVVIGCGKTGEAAARHLVQHGAVDIVLVNRTLDRASDLATELWGRSAGFDTLHRELAQADIAIVATSAERPVVRAASLRFCREHAGTADRPLIVFDLSMPRNVEPEVAGLPQVVLVDLDALHPPMALAEAERHEAVPAAQQIVEEELARYCAWESNAPARDAIQPLHHLLEQLCRREIEFAAGPDVAERTARRIASKLLAHPMQAMRSAHARGESLDRYTEALRQLFAGTEDPERWNAS
jgi:glutamyl-tRNA reductase